MREVVIAAVIIEGTSFTGGKGSVIGAFFSVRLLQVLSTGLILLGVTDDSRVIVTGVVVILAVVFDTDCSRIVGGSRAR